MNHTQTLLWSSFECAVRFSASVGFFWKVSHFRMIFCSLRFKPIFLLLELCSSHLRSGASGSACAHAAHRQLVRGSAPKRRSRAPPRLVHWHVLPLLAAPHGNPSSALEHSSSSSSCCCGGGDGDGDGVSGTEGEGGGGEGVSERDSTLGVMQLLLAASQLQSPLHQLAP